jgi:hypothetical protein
MALIQTGPFVIPTKAQTGGNPVGVPSGFIGEFITSNVMAQYSSLVKAGRVFSAYATLTAPVIFSTAAGTGGPLLWNRPNSNIDAHVLAVGFSTSVVTTVAGGIGLAAGVGQTIAPTAATAIDAIGNMYVGGPATQMGGVFRVGTVANAGSQFFPFAQFHTGALTTDTTGVTWQDVGGILVVAPGTWGSVAATATLTTLAVQVGLIWAELPS